MDRRDDYKEGIFINRAGKGRYQKKGDIEKVIRYVLRERSDEDRRSELISWGAFGLPEWESAEGIIKAFCDVQNCYRRKGRFGRRLDHEIYNFTPFEVESLKSKSLLVLEKAARKMAGMIYSEGYCVIYGIHQEDEGGVHVHFVVNTVSWRTGRKRHENMERTRFHRQLFARIVRHEMRHFLDLDELFSREDLPVARTAEELEAFLS